MKTEEIIAGIVGIGTAIYVITKVAKAKQKTN